MATYWVSPSGTATWVNAQSVSALSGTSCAALTTALSNVVSGDTVYLRGGVYNAGIILNNKNGTLENRITFEAYSDEEPIIENTTNYITVGRYHGLQLYISSYIVVKGIKFTRVSGGYLFSITTRSSYNEVGHCIFDGQGSGVVNIWKGNSVGPDSDACVHNWIHHCTIANTGFVSSSANDEGGMQVGIYMGSYGYEQVSTNTTIEDCVFYSGGHHNLETYSKYNVIRRNYFHHEGSMAAPGPSIPTYGPDVNGLWGNRNIQIYDGASQDGMFNLLERNRFGHSGPPPDDDGGDGMTITAPKNIIRHNLIFNSQNNGIYFKSGTGSISDNNRFYNNTIYKSGRFQNTGPQWQGYSFRCVGIYGLHNITSIVGTDDIVTCVLATSSRFVPGTLVTIKNTTNYNVTNSTIISVTSGGLSFTYSKIGTFAEEFSGTAEGAGPQKGNIIVNNIFNTYGGTTEISLPVNFSLYNTVNNNFETEDGNPLFTDTDVSDPTNSVLPDLRVPGTSPVVGAGTYLTLTNGSGTLSTNLVVDDALFFQDGTWGSSLAELDADWIAVGTKSNVTQIESINYDTNTITLVSAISWENDDPVWLYKDSSGNNIVVHDLINTGAEPGFTTPLAPSGLSAIGTGQFSISLSWVDESSNETGFIVERSPNGTIGWIEIVNLPAETESYTDVSLAPNTRYFYRVKAYNVYGNSTTSNTADATTSASSSFRVGASLNLSIGMLY